MTTTNKLVSLESVMEIVANFSINARFLMEISTEIESLPTYPEPIKWSNHALLQNELDNWGESREWKDSEVKKYIEYIQFRLTEWTEYVIWKEYEFSDNGKSWTISEFDWYSCKLASPYNYIRPIKVSPELTSAMEVMDKYGFKYSKK